MTLYSSGKEMAKGMKDKIRKEIKEEYTKYINLSITEAIELIEAGCEHVQINTLEHSKRFQRMYNNSILYLSYSEYRIEETLLNDFKKNNNLSV